MFLFKVLGFCLEVNLGDFLEKSGILFGSQKEQTIPQE
jgi:hypothetical protein